MSRYEVRGMSHQSDRARVLHSPRVIQHICKHSAICQRARLIPFAERNSFIRDGGILEYLRITDKIFIFGIATATP